MRVARLTGVGRGRGESAPPLSTNVDSSLSTLVSYQIQLFKITLDRRYCILVEMTITPSPPPLQAEVTRRPHKIFADADDANVLVKMEYNTN